MNVFFVANKHWIKCLDKVLAGRFAFTTVIFLATYLWWPALWSGKITLHTDSATLFMPLLSLLSKSLNGGESLLWVSQIYGGHPLFAEGQAGAANPVNILVAYFADPRYGLGLLHYIYMLIGAWGVYKLCNVLEIKRWSSVFVSIAVVFSGAWLHHSHNLAIASTLAWSPWLMVAVECWLKSPSLLRATLLAVPAVLLVFSGYPTITHGVAIYVTASLIVQFFSVQGRSLIKAHWIKYLASGLLAVSLAIGLSAVQLFPLLELVQESHRADGVGMPFAGLTPLSDYLNGLLYLHPQDGVARITASLSSLVSASLAASIIFFKIRLRVLGHVLAGLLLFNLGIEYASPLFKLLYDTQVIPGLHNYRIMHPFLAVAVIGLAISAGYVIDCLSSNIKENLRPIFFRWNGFWPLVGSAFVFLTLLYAVFNYDRDIPFAALFCFVMLLPAGAVLFYIKKNRWLSVLAAFVLFVEVVLVRAHPFDFFPASIVDSPEIVDRILSSPDHVNYRTRMAAHGMEMVFMSGINPDLDAAYIRLKKVLPPFVGLQWGIPSFDGGLALPLSRRVLADQLILSELSGEQSPVGNTRLLDVLGVKYVSFDIPSNIRGFELYHKDEALGILYYINKHAMPKFQTYSRAVMVDGAESAADKIHSVPANCLLVESGLPVKKNNMVLGCADASATNAIVEIIKSTNVNYSLKVTSEKDGWLFVADANFPGWTATVNGAAAPIYSAQVLGKAVFFQAGESSIEFRFVPKSFYIGAMISAATLALMMLILLRSLRVYVLSNRKLFSPKI